ncbi:DsbA family protein [Rahnella perminowiae]|uniref:DsbA family protein n=1 Tax=Rahnella perminowiae TaxID=2816244 RepID=UPI00224B69B5|nr:DsbA family protein [Rahnella perminowiae]MCX2941612.1 DsbA family protein [Rahnella perminowiae]
MFKRFLFIVIYTIFICAVSIGCTVAYYQYIVLNSDAAPLVRVEDKKVARSPLKNSDVFVEIMSYGCHFCAINDKAVDELEKRLPEGVRVVRLHINNAGQSGLARYAPLFATLEVMGLESQYREKIYTAVIKDNIDLADDTVLNNWLEHNGIDVGKYHEINASPAVKALLQYMSAVSNYYDVSATPAFIVNKQWLAYQDRDFKAFGDQLISLLTRHKPLEI